MLNSISHIIGSSKYEFNDLLVIGNERLKVLQYLYENRKHELREFFDLGEESNALLIAFNKKMKLTQ